MKLKYITLAIILALSVLPASASVTAVSRSNCYFPAFDYGYESITWGYPRYKRATSSWHLKDGDHPNYAHNLIDNFRFTWRSIAGDSHWSERPKTYTVKGRHYWAQTEPFNGLYWQSNTYAVSCNL